MKDLEDIFSEIERHKIIFDKEETLLVLWKESCLQLKEEGVPEPYTSAQIVPYMKLRADMLLKVATELYYELDKPIYLEFEKD